MEDISCGLALRGMGSTMRYCPRHHMKMATTTQSISARLLVVARKKERIFHWRPSGRRWKVCDWCQKSLCATNNITIGYWNVRSLRAAGKVEKLAHEMKKYRWNILGLCEVHWKKTLEKCLPKNATRSSSVAVKTDMSLELDSSFTKTLWMPSRGAVQSLIDPLQIVWRHHLLTSPSSKLMPQQLTTMTMTLKTSMINCKKSQTRRQRKLREPEGGEHIWSTQTS